MEKLFANRHTSAHCFLIITKMYRRVWLKINIMVSSSIFCKKKQELKN